MADSVPDQPNIRTDGGRETIPHLDVEVAGAGAFVYSPAIIFDKNLWRHAQDLDGRYEGTIIVGRVGGRSGHMYLRVATLAQGNSVPNS